MAKDSRTKLFEAQETVARTQYAANTSANDMRARRSALLLARVQRALTPEETSFLSSTAEAADPTARVK